MKILCSPPPFRHAWTYLLFRTAVEFHLQSSCTFASFHDGIVGPPLSFMPCQKLFSSSPAPFPLPFLFHYQTWTYPCMRTECAHLFPCYCCMLVNIFQAGTMHTLYILCWVRMIPLLLSFVYLSHTFHACFAQFLSHCP